MYFTINQVGLGESEITAFNITFMMYL